MVVVERTQLLPEGLGAMRAAVTTEVAVEDEDTNGKSVAMDGDGNDGVVAIDDDVGGLQGEEEEVEVVEVVFERVDNLEGE